ncbi:MAG: DEAD/DEAH box helicase, partial [Ancrocorticia sp.]
PYALADLGSGRVEPLMSAFHPSYNTVVNLLADRTYDDARAIMGRSFAQYQRNADLADIEGRAARIRSRIAHEEQNLSCSHGDLVEYLRLRENLGRAAKSARKAAKREYRERIIDTFDRAQTGTLYAFARDKELEYGVVLSTDRANLRVLNWYGEVYWLREDQLSSELRDVEPFAMPMGLSLKSREVRDDIADSLYDAVSERVELGVDRDLLGSWARFAPPRDRAFVDHPVNECPDLAQHMRDGEVLLSLDARLREMVDLTENFTDSVGKDFDRTAAVLLELGILKDDDGVTLGRGATTLSHLHVDNDVLLYGCLSQLTEGELDGPAMAGWASMFLGEDRLGTRQPTWGILGQLANRARREADFLRGLEHRHEIVRTGEVTPGCADVFSAWCSGATLEDCLAMSHMVAGDFINASRRVIDLLGQIVVAGEGTWIEDVAREARDGMRRSELF